MPNKFPPSLQLLIKRRSGLAAKLAAVEEQIYDRLEACARSFNKKHLRGPKRGSGKLTQQILNYLKTRKKGEGIHCREIAKALKVPPQKIFIWVTNTGKNLPNIERPGRGLVALKK